MAEVLCPSVEVEITFISSPQSTLFCSRPDAAESRELLPASIVLCNRFLSGASTERAQSTNKLHPLQITTILSIVVYFLVKWASNIFVLCQTCCYTLSAILSFFYFIPIAVCRGDFNGKCILYTTGHWDETTPTKPRYIIGDPDWGPSSNCGYAIFMGVILMLLSIVLTWRMGVLLLKEIDETFRSALLNLLGSIVILIMQFMACLVVTVGYNRWCNGLLARPNGYDSCSLAALGFSDYAEVGFKVDSTPFPIQMGMAKFGAWLLLIVWAWIVALASVKLYRFHQEESFLTSIAREHERLIQSRGGTNASI
ncbi:PREDICTED: transmembrane protein 179-like [Priapulus caudatus]|uniref:Transmembrane protein 179-like n=1 Tax=Priapulus caudatus TaxID=37621 RepID=A0ABM1E6J1_PRICU|nr:PREDICTED: transmembrane protein 179-like [Priapulus caudatus]